uniref:Mobile element protein n=1 Tax=Klebsiella pneumoniae TaxID=573 RepID=A0A8B0SUE9_KLEPN|nr:Mobile element protein [Klebsiella pneumoniae]
MMKKIIETIESLGCKYLIKAKKLFYTHLTSNEFINCIR